MHLLADPAICGMPLRRRPQLDEVHRLARVHIDVEANAVGHGDRVGATSRQPAPAIAVVQLRRSVHDARPVVERARLADRVGLGEAMPRSRAAATRASAAGGAAGRGTRRSRSARRIGRSCARTRGPGGGGGCRDRRRRLRARARGRRRHAPRGARAAGRPAGRMRRRARPRRSSISPSGSKSVSVTSSRSLGAHVREQCRRDRRGRPRVRPRGTAPPSAPIRLIDARRGTPG